MAIQETRKKIHFTPFDITKGKSVDTSPAPTISMKKGIFRMSPGLINELNLNGKFVRFFYDPIKMVIGFQIKEQVQLQALKGEGKWKLVRQNPTNGSWTVGLYKMLMLHFGKKVAEAGYYQLPVQKYIESSSALTKGEVFYFVELRNEDEPEEPEIEEEVKKEETLYKPTYSLVGAH